MNMPYDMVFYTLLDTLVSADRSRQLVETIKVHPALTAEKGTHASRATIALVMNLRLLVDLLDRVPTGRAYVDELRAGGSQMIFDHGALRTVDLQGMGDLPAGERAITRILEPLGYQPTALYPLDRLGMTGRSYTHADFPEDLPQFFVSELHPQRFSEPFQAAVKRVTTGSIDPLDPEDESMLDRLQAAGELTVAEAVRLLPKLVGCFSRQHRAPALADYEILLAESAEMAWIATEGNAFNHATDRVASLADLVDAQRGLSRPLKEKIEVSRSGRVRQTAFRADSVERAFVADDGRTIHRQVPGSFFEFIERHEVLDPVTGRYRLDLGFDSGNAQGIFQMTAAA